MSTIGTSGGTPTEHKDSMKKVVAASLIGTTIEWYDFFLYGSAAALVFGMLFFPESEPLAGTLLAFGTYAIGFLARPLGGVVFGHFGDRVGRKKMMVISLMMMGTATVAIGLLPTYATLGVAAPILLLVCRLIQGFAVGGEWGGAVLMISERGDPRRRGFWASWPQAGLPAGQALSVAVLAVLAVTMEDEVFNAWGWRVPFLLSGVLIIVGLWIRFSISESPLFREAQEKAEQSKDKALPLFMVLKYYRREVLLAMGSRFCENVTGYLFTAFVLVYGTQQAGLEREQILLGVFIGSLFHIAAVPFWGAMSDRVGRRPIIIFGAVGVSVWGFAIFPLIATDSTFLAIVAISVALILHGAIIGPQAAFVSELFGTSVRFTGASIGIQFASIFAGAWAPMIAVALLAAFGSHVPIAVYGALAGAVTVISLLLARESANTDLAFDRGSAHETSEREINR
ncbi:MFS transporter [Okibacterium endophyticum]